jgi:UDP-GlcNAc:undecaprenyl-phosphate/decaprenyl-phosphate GlcNAc-1-phosphate transferase
MLLCTLTVLLGSFLASALLTVMSKRLALRLGLVAHPQADRYHRQVIPLGGGIGIFLTLALAMLAAILVSKCAAVYGPANAFAARIGIKPDDFLAHLKELATLLLCTAALFAMGLWDDKRRTGPFLKLVVQLLVAFCAAFFADIRIELFIENRLLTSLLSAVWIALLMNVFNFLDNMDGASAGIAAIVSSVLFIAAASSGQILVSGLALILVGTLLGFLLFNFPPAKIFMGDAGSLVIGFFVAVLSLRTTYYHQAHSGAWYPVLLPLVALAVPLYDFVSVTCLRISQGKSPLVGDTQHFSHRLQRHGLTDTQTVLTLYLATLCTGLGATFLYQVNQVGAILIFLQTLMILLIIAIFESKVRHEKAPN